MLKAVINKKQSLDFSGYEAINTICSNISFAGRNLKRIVITSCEAHDGKSFVALQISLSMARRGKRVLLIDGDLRMSRLVKDYDIILDGEGMGLAHVLSGQCAVREAVYETDQENLYLLPYGANVQAPLPLFTGSDFDRLMEAMAKTFDMVVVDTPPIGTVIDAAEIAKRCDGSVLILDYNRTRRRALQDALMQMERTGTPVLGCVLNKVAMSRLSARRYYYHYGYGYKYGDTYYKQDGEK